MKQIKLLCKHLREQLATPSTNMSRKEFWENRKNQTYLKGQACKKEKPETNSKSGLTLMGTGPVESKDRVKAKEAKKDGRK